MRKLLLSAVLALGLATYGPAAGAAPGIDEQAAGHVIHGDYVNETLGFEVKHLAGWESMNRGEMNVNEAIGREAMGLKAGVDSHANGRVFGMHDGLGASVYLSIRKTPQPEPSLTDLKASLVASTKLLPNAHVTDEPTLVAGAARPSTGIRAEYTSQGQRIIQSSQIFVAHGYAVMVMVTSGDAKHLSSILTELRSNLIWR